MKKKNGFTLVELLAVIVVLAIIMIIAIPAILGTTEEAKKESFYLYSQSLQSKAVGRYTQDLNDDRDKTECAVYDIKKDLGLSSTGNYDGWVKVDRIPVSGEKQVYSFDVGDGKNIIEYVYYCSDTKGNTCKPDTSYKFAEGSTNVKVSVSLKAGSKMCMQYQYGDKAKGTMVTSNVRCDAKVTDINTTYKYKITMSLKSDNRAVENYIVSDLTSEGKSENEEASKKSFYEAIENKGKDLEIKPLVCDGEVGGPNKGTTTHAGTQNVSGTTTGDKGTEYVSTNQGGVVGTEHVTTSTTTIRGVDVDVTTTNGNGSVDVTTNTTTQGQTQEVVTTTIDTNDTSLLLSTLNVSGQNIGFSPLKFYYELEVPNNISSLNISATAAMPEVTSVVVDGGEVLNVGSNIVLITLTNGQTGKVSRYRITVKRFDEFGKLPEVTTTTKVNGTAPTEDGKPDPTLDESDASLKYLRIGGHPIVFSKTTYEYSVEVDNIKSLHLEYAPSNSAAIVTVDGNENLKDGDTITIKVLSKNKYYSKQYKIFVKFTNKASSSTKVLRGILVGLSVIAIGSGIMIAMSKAKLKKQVKDLAKEDTEHNVADVIQVASSNGVVQPPVQSAPPVPENAHQVPDVPVASDDQNNIQNNQ